MAIGFVGLRKEHTLRWPSFTFKKSLKLYISYPSDQSLDVLIQVRLCNVKYRFPGVKAFIDKPGQILRQA